MPVIDDCEFDTHSISCSLECNMLIKVVFLGHEGSVGMWVSAESCWFHSYGVLQHLPADTSQAQ